MNIEADKFKIEMSQSELWDTAFDVRSALESTLKTHWVNHQDVWQKNEALRLYRLKSMFTYLGRPELYDQIFELAKGVFEEFNKTKK